jgi:hypothetical protein
MLGIWLALMPLVVVQLWKGQKKKRRRFLWAVLVLFAACLGSTLACGNGTPTPEDLEKICVEAPKNPVVRVIVNRSPEVGYGAIRDNTNENVYRLMLGNFEGGLENRGAYFQGEADIPADVEGDLELVQNVKSSNVYLFADNSQTILSGDWGLDVRDPYQSKSCTPGTHCLVGATDNPANDLSQFVDEQGEPVLTENGEPVLKQLKRSDQFRVFLFWKWKLCPQTRIPLGFVEWSWSAVVQPSENWSSGGDPFVISSPHTDPAVGEVKEGIYDLSNAPYPIFTPFEHEKTVIPAPSQ